MAVVVVVVCRGTHMFLLAHSIAAIQSSLGLPPRAPPDTVGTAPPHTAILQQSRVVQMLVAALTDRDLVLGLLVALSGPSTVHECSAVRRTDRVVGLLRLLRRVEEKRAALRSAVPLYAWSMGLFFDRCTGQLGEAVVQRDRHSDHFCTIVGGGGGGGSGGGVPSRWYCTPCHRWYYGRSYSRAKHNGTAKHKRAVRGFLE